MSFQSSYDASQKDVNVSEMLGLTLTEVRVENEDEIYFTTQEGREFVMYHENNCCERVSIDEIEGEWSNLIGLPLLLAEEVSSEGVASRWSGSEDESFTWTFYKLATNRGTVVIRWYGTSNGYYSESVDFREINIKAVN